MWNMNKDNMEALAGLSSKVLEVDLSLQKAVVVQIAQVKSMFTKILNW